MCVCTRPRPRPRSCVRARVCVCARAHVCRCHGGCLGLQALRHLSQPRSRDAEAHWHPLRVGRVESVTPMSAATDGVRRRGHPVSGPALPQGRSRARTGKPAAWTARAFSTPQLPVTLRRWQCGTLGLAPGGPQRARPHCERHAGGKGPGPLKGEVGPRRPCEGRGATQGGTLRAFTSMETGTDGDEEKKVGAIKLRRQEWLLMMS